MWDDEDDKKSPDTVRREATDAYLGQWIDESQDEDGSARRKARYSGFGRALDAMGRSALAYAEANHLPVGGKGGLRDLLNDGFDLVQGVRLATTEYDVRKSEYLKFDYWEHRLHPMNDVSRKKTPSLGRFDIEALVGQYLGLPFRCEAFDRTLTDLLVALEYYQYADEMLNEEVLPFLGPPRSPLKRRHPLVEYLQGAVVSLCFFGFFGLVAFGLHKLRIIDASWEWGSFIVLTLLFFLFQTIATIALPFAWTQRREQVGKVRLLLAEMGTTYAALHSEGPISARHILELLKASSEKGVVWPAPLYALLDDVVARTGRF
jgi:hypothetical protein